MTRSLFTPELERPAPSPDFNPTKDLWDALEFPEGYHNRKEGINLEQDVQQEHMVWWSGANIYI